MEASNSEIKNKVLLTPENSLPTNMSSKVGKNPDPLKMLSLFDGIFLIIGSIIGSGIFITPNGIMKSLPSLGFSIFIWIGDGILTILGALCYGELGTSIPSSGGEYIYFGRAYHSSVAYAVLWTNIVLLRPIAIAIGAVNIGNILIEIITPGCNNNVGGILIGLVIITSLTFINCLSLRAAISVNNVLTLSKFIALFIIMILTIIHVAGGYNNHWHGSFGSIVIDYSELSVAFLNGLYAYDGWNTLNFVTNELQNPSKNLPLAIIISISTVTVVYTLIIICFSTIIGKYGMLNSTNVTATIASMYMGKPGMIIMSLFICGSIYGTTNSVFYSGGRLFYVAAHKGHLPSIFAKVHKQRKTMTPALILQCIISMIFVLIQQNDILIELFGLIAWITYLLSFIALIVLRKTEPNIKRPYKVPIVIPVVAIVFSIIIIILTFINGYKFSLYAIASIALSFPIYILFYSKKALRLTKLAKFGKNLSDHISQVFEFIMPLSENDISS